MRTTGIVNRLWYGTGGFAERFLLAVLLVPSLLYAGIMQLRSWCYRNGLLTSRRLPKPVISIGNLTVGGTGKTPVTAHLARYLLEKGLRVVVLSRGYGGSLEGQCRVVSDGTTLFETPDACGDEPYLLASSVAGLAVVIGCDRYRAGLLALERLQPDLFLLDDGFQHICLQRDLNILLLDGTAPFGNGHVLPAGPLREPCSALQRCDLVIYTRCATTPTQRDQRIALFPACSARYRLAGFYRITDGSEVAAGHLAGERTVACAGIAQPDSFFDGLAQIGLQPAAVAALADHADYSASVVAGLRELAARHAADWLLTTEKDAVKLRRFQDDLPGITILAARLALEFHDEECLRQAVDKVLSKPA